VSARITSTWSSPRCCGVDKYCAEGLGEHVLERVEDLRGGSSLDEEVVRIRDAVEREHGGQCDYADVRLGERRGLFSARSRQRAEARRTREGAARKEDGLLLADEDEGKRAGGMEEDKPGTRLKRVSTGADDVALRLTAASRAHIRVRKVPLSGRAMAVTVLGAARAARYRA
jgi:hypothetical protein